MIVVRICVGGSHDRPEPFPHQAIPHDRAREPRRPKRLSRAFHRLAREGATAMHRRDFLRFTGLTSAGLAFPSLVPSALAQYSDKWRTYEVTTRVEVLKPAGVTRVWLPTPLTTDTAYLKALGNSQQAEGGTAGTAMDPRYGAGIVWAEWEAGVKPVLVLTSRFSTRDVAVDLSRPGNAKAEDPAVLAKYVAATDLMPTDGIVKEVSSKAVKGARTDKEKAQALYDWVVDNTHRDPKTRGCGVGDIKFMLENKAYGGKCADINALYVALEIGRASCRERV